MRAVEICRSRLGTSIAVARGLLIVGCDGRAGAAGFRTLYSFCVKLHCADGNGVYTNRLLLNSTGTIFGTTGYGGRGEWGTVFQLIPNRSGGRYRHQVLYHFCKNADCPDG